MTVAYCGHTDAAAAMFHSICPACDPAFCFRARSEGQAQAGDDGGERATAGEGEGVYQRREGKGERERAGAQS